MRKRIMFASLLLCLVLFCSCGEESKSLEGFHSYQKMTLLEEDVGTLDPNWLEGMKSQIVDIYSISERDSDKLIRESKFERWQLEYATSQEYENQQYPYCIKADFIIWKGESFYAICDVYDKTVETVNDAATITIEGSDEPWIENLTLLQVLPIDRSVKFTIGSRISFASAEERIGPFTVIQKFYVACPM